MRVRTRSPSWARGRRTRSACPGRCTASSRSTTATGWSGRRSSGTTSAPAAECAEIEERVGLERLIRLTGNRALTGFTAPKLLWVRRHEPEAYARIRHVLLPKDYVRLRLTGDPRDRRRRCLGHAPLRRRRAALERRGARRAGDSAGVDAAGLRGAGRPERARRRRPGRGRARRRRRPAGLGVGRAGHVGCRLRGAARVPAGRRGPRPRLLPRRAGRLARDGSHALGGRVAALAQGRRRAREPRTSTSWERPAR